MTKALLLYSDEPVVGEGSVCHTDGAKVNKTVASLRKLAKNPSSFCASHSNLFKKTRFPVPHRNRHFLRKLLSWWFVPHACVRQLKRKLLQGSVIQRTSRSEAVKIVLVGTIFRVHECPKNCTAGGIFNSVATSKASLKSLKAFQFTADKSVR